MFALMNGVLLRKLPVREQDRVAVVWIEDRTSHFAHVPFTYGTFTALRDQRGAFESLAGIDHNGAWSMRAKVAESDDDARRWDHRRRPLSVLGSKPLIGRVLNAGDDVVADRDADGHQLSPAANAFGADRQVLGKR